MYLRRWAEYDPKSIENIWGIVEKMNTVVFFDPQHKIMYICGKCFFTTCMRRIFTISMQKTVRAQIGPVKKRNSHMKVQQYVRWLCIGKS